MIIINNSDEDDYVDCKDYKTDDIDYHVKVKVKCTPCTGTEALYRPYSP